MTTTERTPAPRAARSNVAARLASFGTLIGLVGLIALFAILKPQAFLTPLNFSNILEQLAILAMIAAVQTVVMVVGDFDLSVGALASLTGVLTAQLLVAGLHPALAIAAGLAAGLLAGALNGFLVAYLVVLLFVAEPLRNSGKFTMADVLAYRLRQRPVRTATLALQSAFVVTAGIAAVAVAR